MPIKYFLSKRGSQTQRLASVAGHGHYDLAKLVLTGLGQPPAPDTDVYAQMAKHGHVRVVEDGSVSVVWVDAPRTLTTDQKVSLKRKENEGWIVVVNNKAFVEGRQLKPSAKELVAELTAS